MALTGYLNVLKNNLVAAGQQQQQQKQQVQKQNGGWYDGVQYWAPGQGPQNNNQPSQPNWSIPSGPSDEELNSYFNPLQDSLNQQEAALGTQRTADEGLINQQQTDLLGSLSKAKTSNEEYQQQQLNRLEQQKQASNDEQVRAYNAMQQRGQSRFGRGSSAGQAVGEIAQQEYFKQQGQLGQTYANQTQEAQTKWKQWIDWSLDEELRIKRESQGKLNDISKMYTQALLQINQNRNMIQSEKAQRKMEARMAVETMRANLNNQMIQQENALKMYGQQLQMQIAAELQANNQNRYTTGNDTFAGVDTGGYSGVGGAQQYQQQRYVPISTSRRGDDEEDNNLLYYA